jgi:hypothetical protein
MATLRLAPITVKKARPFVALVHRKLKRVQGAMWAVSVWGGGELVGVALVGNPARVWNGEVLCVLRVAVIEGNPNACSMLYGACSRAAKAMGARNLVTYTHLNENGASLKASNWVPAGLTDDDAEWHRRERPRQLAIDPEMKCRWFAPWSEKAIEARAKAIENSVLAECERCHDRVSAGTAVATSDGAMCPQCWAEGACPDPLGITLPPSPAAPTARKGKPVARGGLAGTKTCQKKKSARGRTGKATAGTFDAEAK